MQITNARCGHLDIHNHQSSFTMDKWMIWRKNLDVTVSPMSNCFVGVWFDRARLKYSRVLAILIQSSSNYLVELDILHSGRSSFELHLRFYHLDLLRSTCPRLTRYSTQFSSKNDTHAWQLSIYTEIPQGSEAESHFANNSFFFAKICKRFDPPS